MKKVSLGSGEVSPFTGTVIVRVVWPGAKVSVPFTAVKSPGSAALPFEVKKSTETVFVLAVDIVTVKVALIDPLFPSVTVTSLIDSDGGTTVNEVLDVLLLPVKSEVVVVTPATLLMV